MSKARAIVLLKAGTVLELMKASMGYTDNARRCHSCVHFVPDDCSGNHDALPSHCTLNPALPFPVQKDGLCDHHTLLPAPEPQQSAEQPFTPADDGVRP